MEIWNPITFDPVADMLDAVIQGYGIGKVLTAMADICRDRADEEEVPEIALTWRTRARILTAMERRNAFRPIVPEEI